MEIPAAGDRIRYLKLGDADGPPFKSHPSATVATFDNWLFDQDPLADTHRLCLTCRAWRLEQGRRRRDLNGMAAAVAA